MARSAVVQDQDPRAALLEARLKAWFDTLAAQPVPVRLLRHVDRLDRHGADYARLAPETR